MLFCRILNFCQPHSSHPDVVDITNHYLLYLSGHPSKDAHAKKMITYCDDYKTFKHKNDWLLFTETKTILYLWGDEA